MGNRYMAISVSYFCSNGVMETLQLACLADMGGLWRECGAKQRGCLNHSHDEVKRCTAKKQN